ncbi:MAG: hypothetical protein H6Q33_2995 [Deltaproteobacteria bacterium]|nr:hypothetical protein [Deltaproteobacteria bacterium]
MAKLKYRRGNAAGGELIAFTAQGDWGRGSGMQERNGA